MKAKIHYVASTHWDREWHLPFQGFRYRLVKLADKLLTIMEEDADFKQFVFDGQTSVLDDILEIKPELRPRFETLCKAGRLHIGPWHTMPDERIVSGEALIRNLLLGAKTARSFGVEPMPYGYICDIFGHIAQMPQIFEGFNIKRALLGRGTNAHTHPPFFTWESPDGSRAAVFRLPDVEGYGNARHLHDKAEAEAANQEEWSKEVAKAARELFEAEKARGSDRIQLWLDGLDHYMPSTKIPQALEVAAKELEGEAEIVFSSLPEFAADADRLLKSLPISKGEQVKTAKLPGGYCYLISHCLSSHYPMKRLNDRCQSALERWLEPYFALAQIEGRAPAKGFLDLAWKYVLQNQAHDSICGCSVDQVHKDTEYRYDQCLAIVKSALDEILPKSIARKQIEGERSVSLAVFSPLPFARKKIVEAEFVWPDDFARMQLQGFPDDKVPCFSIENEKGETIPCQLLSYKERRDSRRIVDEDFSAPCATVVKALFEAEFDGIGPKVFKAKESAKPVRMMESLLTGRLSAENEHLELSINADGSMDIIEKGSGVQFKGLMSFEDCGEMGDGWYHASPVADSVFMSQGCPSEISVVESGALRAVFKVVKRMRLPEDMDFCSLSRSKRMKDFEIASFISLEKGAKSVGVKIQIDNNVKDHRLKAVFASGVEGAKYFASQPFAYVERERGVDKSTFDWKEADVEERSFCGVAGVSDGRKGLALIAGRGLHEIAVRDGSEGAIALTLFRSFRKTVGTAGQTRGQIQGKLEFEFALAPFAGKPDFIELEKLAQDLSSGVETYAAQGRKLESRKPFLRLGEGKALLSALKVAEDGKAAIARFFNPSPNKVSDMAQFDRAFKDLKECGMDEKPRGKTLEKGKSGFKIELPPFKARSFRIEF